MQDVVFRRKVLDVVATTQLRMCVQCSRCVDHCPIAIEVGSDKYNPRKLIMESFLGMKDPIFGQPAPAEGFPENFNLWGCTVCDKCDELCPNSIPLTEVFYVLKNISTELGQAPEFYYTQAKTIAENGKAIPIMDAIKRRRTSMGLAEELPAVDMNEINTILEATELKKVLK
ncbi:MAG: 4Fe-4S dicluster domain-containing protein [Candidatus Helarchaeota archaeon]